MTKRRKTMGFETTNDQKEADALWVDMKNAHCAGLALIQGARAGLQMFGMSPFETS